LLSYCHVLEVVAAAAVVVVTITVVIVIIIIVVVVVSAAVVFYSFEELVTQVNIAHLPQQCHNSKFVIFQEKLLKVLKCYNFL
jgi:hypothetical protein